MKTRQIELVSVALLIAVMLGLVVFFLWRMRQEAQTERIDMRQLILRDAVAVAQINDPAKFLGVLEQQPCLKQYFVQSIPDDYFRLLRQIRQTPVLLTYYPRGTVMLFRPENSSGEFESCFANEETFTVEKDNRLFVFYPRTKNRFFGSFRHGDVCVVSYSRKLLEAVNNQIRFERFTSLEELRKGVSQYDKHALLNVFYPVSGSREWHSADIRLRQQQVCCVINETLIQQTDSIVTAIADSLAQKIRQIIPGIELQQDYSLTDSLVLYSFCATLTSPGSDRQR